MNVVIDTNVFISSFFGGNPGSIIDLWKNRNVTLCLSKEILDEYVDVLERLDLDRELVGELLSLFAAGRNILFSVSTPALSVVREDPDDDKFINCAVALKAEAIITGDKALLNVREYSGIRIVTPRQFLDEI